MIAWFGPAVLLLLFAAARPAQAEASAGAVACTLAEELAAVVAGPVQAPPPAAAEVERVASDAPPRAPSRWRSVRESGLPAPRAP